MQHDLLSCAIHIHHCTLLSFHVQCTQLSEDTERHAKARTWAAASRVLVYSTAGKFDADIFCHDVPTCRMSVSATVQ